MPIKMEGFDELIGKLDDLSHPEIAKIEALDTGAEYLREKIADSTNRSEKSHKHTADSIIVKNRGDVREIGPDSDHHYYTWVEFGRSDRPDQTKGKGQWARVFHAEIKNTQSKMAAVFRRMFRL